MQNMPKEEEEEEEAVFIRRRRRLSLLVKIERDPLNSQHAQHRSVDTTVHRSSHGPMRA